MKKHHSPRGKRSALRLLAYAFATVAIVSAGQVIVDHDGTASKKLGVYFNDMLMSSAKLGLGLSSLHPDKKGAAVSAPTGMKIVEKKKTAVLNQLPDGLTKEGEDTSLAGKGSKVLGQAAQKAFVAAADVEIYAK